MACTCTRGPGKFEGEPALAALAWYYTLDGGADETIGDLDFFEAPFQFDADSGALEFANGQGYCYECITAALADQSYALSVRTSDDGFVYLTCYPDRAAYEDELNAAGNAAGLEEEP